MDYHSLHNKLIALALIVIYISVVVIVHHLYAIKLIWGKNDFFHSRKKSLMMTKLYIDLLALFWFISLPIHGFLLCFKYLYYLPKGER